MDIFKNARLKLTAWYLVIIMFVSLSFSVLIYKSITSVVQHRFLMIEKRLDLRGKGFLPPPGAQQILFDDIKEIENGIVIFLFYINSSILVFSSIAGYFLAGKTLEPIEETLEREKRFIADASHELKTPLTSLQTSIEVALRDKKLDLKEAKKTLFESLDEVKTLNNLSHYLLNLSRVNETSNSNKKIVYLDKLVEEAANKFEKRSELELKLIPVKVNVNSEEVKQLVSLLIDNAIKYSSKNIDILLKENNEEAVLSIKDYGIGISKKDLPRIFDRFFRADKSRNKTVKGFGLGLSLARKLADNNNIKIEVQSKIGKGTTFKLILKLA